MATAKRGQGAGKSWKGTAFLVLLVAAAGGIWLYGDSVSAQARAGTSFGAKNACSCRYIGGRDLASCKGDSVPGMEMVFLSEDEDEQAVTAYVPLVASDTARFHEGFGCMLDRWEQ